MTMNETVDSVYRFVTDQSSSAYNKMNSLVASLRRRFDKILTVPTNANNSSSPSSSLPRSPSAMSGEIALLDELLTDARMLLAMTTTDHEKLITLLHAAEKVRQNSESSYSPTTTRRYIAELRSLISPSHSDDYYLTSSKQDSHTNVYDTLNKNRPLVRSNPNIHSINKNEPGKPAQMQRNSLRSSMRHFMKRRSMKGSSKKFLDSTRDSQTSHIYESLDTPTPDQSPSINPLSSSTSTNSEIPYTSSGSTPTIFKSTYIIPSSLVVLDHFTTNLYLVVNATLNQLLVVFGSTKIHTIKMYDTDGKKILPNDLVLQYKFEDLHGYKLLSSAFDSSVENRIIVNEIRVYVSQTTDEIHNPSMAAAINSVNNQTLKQRLSFFDSQGRFISASKRLPVSNELMFVEVDRKDGSIYAYDGFHLINIEHNWSTIVENMNCIASGSNVVVCLHGKTNQISIYNSQTGSFIYRWLITTSNIRHLQAIHLCISREDLIYVLVWNCDVHPVNNLVLVFDQEGQLKREYYVPNRILQNLHGSYSYEVTLGGTGHQTNNPLANLMRRSSRKPDVHSIAWLQQPAIWSNNGHHPQMWPSSSTASAAFAPIHRGLGRAYDLIYQQHQQQQQQQHEDHTLFHPRFIAITDDDTLILSNIIDLGLDEETQETAVVNVSRKILFFHLDT